MSDLRVSVCCGAEACSFYAGDYTAERALNCNRCLACDKECDVETIAQRDHRMRVEGAEIGLSGDPALTAEALVTEHEKGAKR